MDSFPTWTIEIGVTVLFECCGCGERIANPIIEFLLRACDNEP